MTSDNATKNARAAVLKAHAALRAARALAELELFDDAASRLYYAVFHLVSAALLAIGIQARTHVGLMPLLGQHLVKPGLLPTHVARDYATLLGLRGQADYNRHFVMDADGFTAELARAETLFTVIRGFLETRGVEWPSVS